MKQKTKKMMKKLIVFSMIALFFSCSQSLFNDGSKSLSLKSESRAITAERIEAENYTSMNGIQTQGCSEGTDNVGWTDVGDWMDYSINVPVSGEYTVNYRVASPETTGQVQFKSGSSVLATTDVPNTGGWQDWTTVSTKVNLNNGNQTVRLYVSGKLFNINWFELQLDDTGDSTPINTVSFLPSGDGDMKFSLTVETKKTQVHLFTRKNGVQDYEVMDLQNSNETQNSDGTYTYSSTRLDSFINGDLVEARFYTYSQIDGQVFYPGPNSSFDSIIYDGSTGGDGGDGVTISGRQILIDGSPFYIKGVCWNPIGVGGSHPGGISYSGYVAQDAKLMQEAGINAIRTYETITDTNVLDELYARGIYVINTVYSYGPKDYNQVISEVNQVKDHPAILMWALGNEWNYNGLYVGMSFNESVSKIKEVAALIKAADPNHPIASVYGVWGDNLPPNYVMDDMSDIDVWGINTYSGLNFGNILNLWKNHSTKPMFMAEYGADAWNTNTGSEDAESQGEATRVLTGLLLANNSAENSNNVCSGGTIFEWADEWWKDGNGSPWEQDSGGMAPGGGPFPDSVFNEEYWGIVDIYRNPRPAYYELQKLFTTN